MIHLMLICFNKNDPLPHQEQTMSNQATGSKSVTIENLESAFAGESMAHIKYRYFAKLAR